MTRSITDDVAEVEEAGEPAQGVTLSIPTHMAAPSHALVLREGPKPTRPRGRIPRVARLLALAHHRRATQGWRGRDPGRTRRARQAHPGSRCSGSARTRLQV